MTATHTDFHDLAVQRERFVAAVAAFAVDDRARIERALVFAERAHAGQSRKGSARIPYIIHPMRIARTLVEEFGVATLEDSAYRGSDVVIAGLLHDVVEDCGVDVREITKRFGSIVEEFVGWLTWERGQDAKWRSATRLRHAPRGVRMVKAADILDNAHDYTTADAPRRMVLRARYGYDRWGRTVIATLGTEYVARLDAALATLDATLTATAVDVQEKANGGKQIAIDVGSARRCRARKATWSSERKLAPTEGSPESSRDLRRWYAVALLARTLVRYSSGRGQNPVPTKDGVHRSSFIVHRFPLRTPLITPTTNLLAVIRECAVPHLLPGDALAISERIVAITQGRAYRLEDIHPSRAASFLVRFVTRSPYGIGLGSPWTMELAIREAGLPRIILGCLVAAATKPFGITGMFYRVVGKNVNAIDGPCDYTLAPFGKYAKLGPKDPERVAESLAREIGVDTAIIDANDLGVTVLGASDGVNHAFVRQAFRDNPLGQSREQTPMAIVRLTTDH